MRANQILPIMLAGTAGCLDLQALQSDAKDAAMPPVEDMASPVVDMAMPAADMANPARDMANPDMTTPVTNWKEQHSIKNLNLYAIHGKTVGADTSIWVVGEKSKEAHFTTASNTWTNKDMDAAKMSTFRSMWAASEKVVWAAGDGGVLYKGDNAGTWTPQTSGVTGNLTGIFGNSGTDLMAVGADANKVITSSDGTAWNMLTHGQNSASNSVYLFGTNTFMANPNGVALRSADRSNWILDSVQSTVNFNSVSGSDEKNVYIAGSGGYIAKWDGMKWTSAKVDATGRDFLSIWAISATDIWAVGKLGMVYRGDGAKWTFVGPGTTSALVAQELRGVWGDAKGVYVVSYDAAAKDSFVYKY